MNNLGLILKNLLNKNNMTMKELGERLGKSESAVSYWISGKSVPRLETLKEIADIFKISLDDLIAGKRIHPQWNDDFANRKHLAEVDPEKLEIYEDLVDRDDLKILFSKVRALSPKDVESIISVVQTIRNAKGIKE